MSNERSDYVVYEDLRYRVVCDDGTTYTGKSREDADDYRDDYVNGRITPAYSGPDSTYG